MKKLIVLSLTLLMTISFVISGVTLAFFSDQESVGSSVFEMGQLSLTSVNIYSALDDPFTYEKNPSWMVQNTGTMRLTLRVKVVCEWAQAAEAEAVIEVANEVASEHEGTSEILQNGDNVLLIDDVIDNEKQSLVESEMGGGELPTFVVTFTSDLWTQDEEGWFVYRDPILPNETIEVNAEVLVMDPEWEGDLALYFEAEAQEVSSGGGYE